MDDMFRIALAIAIIGIGIVGTYVYWERKKKSSADGAARRRAERKRQADDKVDRPTVQPAARQPGFGRR